MTESYTKLSDVIAKLRGNGYIIQEKPMLVITSKDKRGMSVRNEIDLSQTMIVSCENSKCHGRGVLTYEIDPSDGILKCAECHKPVALKHVDTLEEIKSRFSV